MRAFVLFLSLLCGSAAWAQDKALYFPLNKSFKSNFICTDSLDPSNQNDKIGFQEPLMLFFKANDSSFFRDQSYQRWEYVFTDYSKSFWIRKEKSVLYMYDEWRKTDVPLLKEDGKVGEQWELCKEDKYKHVIVRITNIHEQFKVGETVYKQVLEVSSYVTYKGGETLQCRRWFAAGKGLIRCFYPKGMYKSNSYYEELIPSGPMP